MRIMFVVNHYRPDGGPSAPLFSSLGEELVRRGHQVTVLTSVPHYPSGQVPKEYRGKLRMQAHENGVEVVRLALPSVNRRNLAQRMIQFISYQIGATLAGWNRKYHVYLTASSALQMWLPFAFLAVLRRKPAVYSVHDLYPDIGVKLGVFRHKPLVRLVASLENFCLKYALRVRVLSKSFIPDLVARGVPESKLCLIYDWVDTDMFRPLPRDNSFAVEHGLVDRFVVLYAGNIGFLQGLEHVVEAANLLKDHDDVCFVFVGDGSAREALVEKAGRLKLSNVNFLPHRSFEQMPEVLATADVSLVTLLKGGGLGALPSKILAIFASGRPLLASIDEGSDAWSLVERAQAGLCVPPEDPLRLSEAVLTMKHEDGLCDRLGRNGRIWAERYHSPQSAAKQFEELFLAAIASKGCVDQPD